MQASQTPTRVTLPFAANGTKNPIPAASQISVTPGAASLNDGFPPLTFTPIAAGGVPPFGADFNGILNLITQTIRWEHAGGSFGYNSAFATDPNVGGYPRGALLARADNSGLWLNQTDNNTTNPDTGGAGWTPAFMSGVVGQARNLAMTVSAASASATLTADEIVVSSALGGQKYVLASFSKTLNLATTGAGGMDTGAAPANGFVALYAIYNPTTGTSALLATNATSAVAPNVYGGANMPSGYTASGLIGVWPTNASGQFVPGYQKDRRFWYSTGVSILNASTVSTTFTSVSATCLPFNAKLGVGYMGVTGSTSPQVYGSYVAADSSGGAQDLSSIYAVSGSVASYGEWTIPIQTAQTIYYKNSLTSGATFSVVCRGYEI